MMGLDRRDRLPSEINNIIDTIIEEKTLTACIEENGYSFDIKGIYMEYYNGQQGVILVLSERGNNGNC